ncbi:MAG TPA: MFS transporter [Verrucomicrobiae bacterium]|nr:MFS transporter [Verrucomicrobiae bacterium]
MGSIDTASTTLIRRGTPEYRRVNLALFIAGFVTFSTLYDFQPLMPVVARDFGVTPAAGSLTLSAATLALAITLPVSGTLSDLLGRRRMMIASVLLTSLLALASAWCPSMHTLLAARLLQGVVLAGVPAVAMAYLGDEVEQASISAAMGLYISGNALGGMTGRMLTALLADFLPWRGAVAGIGGLSLVLALLFVLLIPPSRNFRPRAFHPLELTRSLLRQLREPGLLCLYAVAFCSMGAFVTLYNYSTFRLLAPPYSLSQGAASLIFASYLLGMFGSSWMGALAGRIGRSRVLFAAQGGMAAAALLTLLEPLAAVALGIGLFTLAYFGAHAVASAWVGTRAGAGRAQASSLYLFSYYLGSSVLGTGGGFLWSWRGWSGVTMLILALVGCAFAAACRLALLEAAGERAPAAAAVCGAAE